MRRVAAAGARAVLAAVVTCGLGAFAVLAAAAPASAHTKLKSSTPANGAAVPTAPDRVELLFGQHLLGLGTIAVQGPDGASVTAGDAVLDGATVTQALVANRPAGTYRIAYRVVSADGHPVTGELTFTATGATGATGAPSPTSPAAATAATQPASSPPTAAPADGSTGGATTAAGAAGETAEDGGSSTGLVVGIVVGAAVLAAGAGLLVARRRRAVSRDN